MITLRDGRDFLVTLKDVTVARALLACRTRSSLASSTIFKDCTSACSCLCRSAKALFWLIAVWYFEN